MAAVKTIKFLYSYGGKILPRPLDSNLRYFGGLTRVVSVHRNVSFSELMVKLEGLCGYSSVNLRCKLPNEDLDVLISIKSNDDLINIIEEYDKASLISGKDLKIRAILSTAKSPSLSPSSSSSSSVNLSPLTSDRHIFFNQKPPLTAINWNFPARKSRQYGGVRDCYYYRCQFQANGQPSLYLVQHLNRSH